MFRSISCSDYRPPHVCCGTLLCQSCSLWIFIFWTSQQRSQAQTGKFDTKLSDASEEAEGGSSKKTKPHEDNWADGISSKMQSSCIAWRAHTRALSQKKHMCAHTHTHSLTHTHTHTHTNTHTHTYQHCLRKLRHWNCQQISNSHLNSSIVKWHAF